MGLLFFILFGFVVGLVARAIMPGEQKLGLVLTAVLGVAGAFIGGVLVSLITGHRITDFHAAGVVGSVVGALVLLVIAGTMRRGRAHA